MAKYFNTCPAIQSPRSLAAIKNSLNIMSTKRPFIEQYCKDAINYYNIESVASSFQTTYMYEYELLTVEELKSLTTLKGKKMPWPSPCKSMISTTKRYLVAARPTQHTQITI
jgi:hypothetical protein